MNANWQADCPKCVASKFTCDAHYGGSMSANELIERLGPHLSHTGMSAAQASQWLRDAASNVERSRNTAIVGHLAGWEHRLMRSCADRLEAQAAEIEKLREALRPFSELADLYENCEQHPQGCPETALCGELPDLTVGHFRRARQALLAERKKGGEA